MEHTDQLHMIDITLAESNSYIYFMLVQLNKKFKSGMK